MAICEKLEIKTKTNGVSHSQKIIISRKDFKKDKISDVKFNIIYNVNSDELAKQYTEVKLIGFDKDKWEEFNNETLYAEIQKHFEPVLKNPSITIKLKEKNKSLNCMTFKYDSLEGETFKKEIEIITGKGNSKKTKKAKIFLKYTSNRNIERPIVFFSKDRRINEVSRVKLFDSNKKQQIWSNPQLTGYIDTGDILSPTLTRDTYKNDPVTKKLFSKIREIESEILAFLNNCNQRNLNTHFQKIENFINEKIKKSIIRKAKIIREPKIGDIVTLAKKGQGTKMKCIQYELLQEGQSQTEINNLRKQNIKGNKIILTKVSANYKIANFYINNVMDDSFLFNIKIEGDQEAIKDKFDNPLVSILEGDTIILYKKHKDFNDRIRKNSSGEEFITSSLISLIIIEFLSHHLKQMDTNREDIKEFKELYYLLEQEMKDLDGEALTSYN